MNVCVIVISTLVIVELRCQLQKENKKKIKPVNNIIQVVLRLNEKWHYRFAGGGLTSSV